jgi:hypothetical protein
VLVEGLALLFSTLRGGEMSCCDREVAHDREVTGVCPVCEGDIDQDGQTVEDGCGYSPVECEACGFQPCDESC